MGAKIGGTGGPQADINVTPLVDIVLVLLIIFMVITPLLAKNLPIEVPQKAELEEPPDEIKDQVVLKLFTDGHIEVNKETVELANVEDVLRDTFDGKADKVMFFEGEDEAPYGNAVHLMDLAKGAGVTTIGIMTPPDEPEFDPLLEGGVPLEGGALPEVDVPAPE